MTIRIKLIIGFIVLIVIFVISFLVNQQLSNTVIRNSEYLNKSEAVIRNSNRLHKTIIDMQSGFRGYLLTSQESFLQPYHEGITIIPPLRKELDSLFSSREQKARLDTIIFLHDEWEEYANSLIITKMDTLPEASARYKHLFESKLKMEVGKKINDKIRNIFVRLDEHEYKVRRERRENLEHSIDRTRNINLTLTLFSIGIAIVLSIYLISFITRRIKRMVNQAEEIAKGNFVQMDDKEKDELKKLSEALNSMSQILEKNFKELKKKNYELDQFAYVVSHDLKAPLRGILNIMNWLEEDHGVDITPEIRKNLDLISGRARRLENMINGLLEYARIGKSRKRMEQVNVQSLVEELKEMLMPDNFKLVTHNLPTVLTEKIQLEQVFSNLISNAVKYNDRKEGFIEITAKDKGAYYEFTVKDNGIGIEREYFDKIFVIFQTLRERDAFESTGVGLAIVKRIVEEQKGHISVESEPGKGTTFKFEWYKND
jgi:signal transduction histidine kinase